MFEAKTPLRKFGKYQSDEDGIGAAVTRIERRDKNDPTIAKIHAQIHSDSVDEGTEPAVKNNST